MNSFKDGDWVLLVTTDGAKTWISRVGTRFTTAQGTFDLNDLIGKSPGCSVISHRGYRLYAFRPTPSEFLLRGLERQTSVAYPKELSYIIHRCGIGPGARVVEAGSGSGASTIAFAFAVGSDGHVFSYEKRAEFSRLAQENVEAFGLSDRVTFRIRDIAEGFDEQDADLVFLDVREPWLYLDQALGSVADGGFLVILVPTTNQVVETLRSFSSRSVVGTEVLEILHRPYKPVADRLRPEDRMVAHTAFVVITRKVTPFERVPEPQTPEGIDSQPDSGVSGRYSQA